VPTARKFGHPMGTYIIVLSDCDSEDLMPGADCYWNRHSSDEEFLARLRTAMRTILLHAE
jgi:hypothetical protein